MANKSNLLHLADGATTAIGCDIQLCEYLPALVQRMLDPNPTVSDTDWTRG